jgi:hypothetical protein
VDEHPLREAAAAPLRRDRDRVHAPHRHRAPAEALAHRIRGCDADETRAEEGADDSRGIEAQETLAAFDRRVEGVMVERPGLLEVAGVEAAQLLLARHV